MNGSFPEAAPAAAPMAARCASPENSVLPEVGKKATEVLPRHKTGGEMETRGLGKGKKDEAARLAMVFLRERLKMNQAGFAEASGIAPSLLSAYERGDRTVSRRALERAARSTGFPVSLLEPLLRGIRALLIAEAGRWSAEGMLAEVASLDLHALARSGASLILGLRSPQPPRQPVPYPAAADREAATILGARLKRWRPAERRVLVEEAEEFRSWAVAEWLAAASLETAGDDPDEALALADLALFVAERIPGDETFRRRIQGYAWAHVANARRVQGRHLPGADAAFATARKLWEEGAPGDPGLLEGAIVPWLEATLRHAQGLLPEALNRIQEGLLVDRGRVRVRLLYTKTRILEGQGDLEGAMTTLREAASLVDADREPRLALGIRFQLLVNLCHLGRADEAEQGLPEVRALAEQAGKELDRVRVVWLKAKIAAGRGRDEEAREAFKQVRRELGSRKLPFDYALASLELAGLHLERGRTEEVRALAREMLPIFREQEVPQEALKALRLFCAAAERDAATAELARRIVLYLYQARQDPGLRFEA